MLTIHTLPLCTGAENAGDNTIAKVVRSVENKTLYGDWFGGRWLKKKKMPHKFWPGEAEISLVIATADGDKNNAPGASGGPSSDEKV